MYYLLKSISWLMTLVGIKNLSYVARFLTFVFFDLFSMRKKTIMKNLNIAFGDTKTEKEKEKIARASVFNFLLNFFEFMSAANGKLSETVAIEGHEHIEEALKENKGAYILCFHLGNWEAMGAGISHKVKPAHVLVKKVGGASVDRFVTEQRTKNGFLVVSRKKKGDGYRAIKTHLRDGDLIGFVMDQARPGEPALSFMGSPAKTNTSFAAIWRKIQAPIVMSYITRKAPGEHVVRFEKPFKLKLTDDKEKDVLIHSQQFNDLIEVPIKKHPDQYFWMHNRWKL